MTRSVSHCFGRPLLPQLVTTIAVCFAIAGCSSGPAAVEPPSIDADGAAAGAMEMYDKDGDGYIAGSELEAAPELAAAMATLDENNDEKVTAEEITNRILSWQKSRAGMTAIRVLVKLDGRPVEGATVEFVPASYLGDEVKAAKGVTSLDGIANPLIPKEQRPTPDTPPGVQFGLYRVKISKSQGGSDLFPARYNEETVLGQQIAGDDPAVIKQLAEFELKTK